SNLSLLNDELTVDTSPTDLRVRFTDPPLLLLFNIGAQADLDNGISAAIRQEFERQKLTLSANAVVTVEQPRSRWTITDQGKKYFLRKKSNSISVFTLAGNYNWSLDTIDNGKGSLDFVLRPEVGLKALEPGLVALNVTYVEQDAQSTLPYAFEIRLNP